MKGAPPTGNNPVHRVLLLVLFLVLFNSFMTLLIYTEATDDERIIPVRGISMMHGEPRFGAVDPGDGVIIRPYDSNESVVTAESGWRIGTFSGGYAGDVIGFYRDGKSSDAICHRVLFFMRFNVSKAKENDTSSILIDVPERNIYGKRTIFVRSYSFSDHLYTDVLLGPYLKEGGLLTNESISEIGNTSGFITAGDNNQAVDQTYMRPVRYEWIMGKVEVVDNPYGAHGITSIYLLSAFMLFYLAFNIWAYRERFEKRKPLDKRLFVVFYMVFISMYFTGYVGHLYRYTPLTGIDRGTVLAETALGAVAAIACIAFRPEGRPLFRPGVSMKNSLGMFIGHRRQRPILQAVTTTLLAYAFLKFGLVIASQTLLFLMFMAVFYYLSIPIYISEIDPSRSETGPGTESEADERKSVKNRDKKVPGAGEPSIPVKPSRLKVLREHALLDWTVLSVLMLLLGLVYFGEGFGFIYLLVVGGFFGNLLLLNLTIKIG